MAVAIHFRVDHLGGGSRSSKHKQVEQRGKRLAAAKKKREKSTKANKSLSTIKERCRAVRDVTRIMKKQTSNKARTVQAKSEKHQTK